MAIKSRPGGNIHHKAQLNKKENSGANKEINPETYIE